MAAAIACGVLVLAVHLARPRVVEPLNHYQYDVLMQNRAQWPRLDPRLVFFMLDDGIGQLLASRQQDWPTYDSTQLGRVMHAELLLTLGKVGTQATVWDVLFDRPSRPPAPGSESDVDTILAEAVGALPTVLATQASLVHDERAAAQQLVGDLGDRLRRQTFLERFKLGEVLIGDIWPVQPIQLRSLPMPALVQQAAGAGHVISSEDFDHKVRRIPLITRVGTRLFPSLALAGALQALPIDPAREMAMDGHTLLIPLIEDGQPRDLRVPLDRDGWLYVNYLPDWFHQPNLDRREYSKVFPSLVEFPEDMGADLAGKVVLVGMADGETDLITTPVQSLVPGALATYFALNSLLTDQFIAPAPWWLEHVLTLGLPTLLGLLFLLILNRPILTIFVTTGLFAGLIGSAIGLFYTRDVFLPIGGPAASLGLAVLLAVAITQVQVTYRSSRLANILSRFVSPALLQELYTRGLKGRELGVQRREISVMFVDVAGFTELTDRSEPEEIAEFLAMLYPVAMRVLEANHGTLDKFLGDGILAYFGAPDDLPAKEQWAVRAALALQEGFGEVAQAMREKGRGDLAIRAGITTGFVTVGYLGGRDRAAYTIVGRPVNMAARLEAAAPPGGVLVDRKTAASADDAFELEETQPLELKGIAKPVPAWRVIRERTEPQ
jgi:adenylate cyclase